ncbi:hypothetical protein ACH5RR_002837 [Cinchona calisaya]|uniref:RNase H type-1 domain-containing protein n=1 Tax=Cinchona calisaya TaxID=153742 RepID=A0ABD3AT47_9GENT
MESLEHLFLYCPWSSHVWRKVCIFYSIHFNDSSWNSFLSTWWTNSAKASLVGKLSREVAAFPILLKWSPLPHPVHKLNTDGAFREAQGLASGGGALRNHQGKILVGFSHTYSYNSSLEVEARAMLDGVKLALEHSVVQVQIEADSAILFAALMSQSKLPWKIAQIV